MSAKLVVTGDTAELPANCFKGALTDALSIPITGSAKFKVGGKLACVLGDEQSVVLACTYSTAAFTTKGAGTVTIQALAATQQSQVARSTKVALLAQGPFIAQLQVTAPASVVNAAGVLQTDPLTLYVGQGEFKTQNEKASASR